MWSPRRGLQQLYLLGHQQRPELGCKAFDEIRVRIHCRPMSAAIGVVIEFPEMDKLIDRPGVGLKVADELLVLSALLECWKANLLVELHGLGHCPDPQSVRSQFVKGHRRFPLA